MWEDPIVKETRALREEYAAKFNYDINLIFDNIIKRQRQTKRKLVSFSARKPLKPKAAYHYAQAELGDAV